jgi:probable phosphoglycerate mutase
MTDLVRKGFWFLRHGETDWNARNLAQGSVETRLNARGLEQAHAAAAALTGHGIAGLFSSPLTRARETADVVGTATGLIPIIEHDLRETSYGVEEGLVMSGWFDDWVAGVSTPHGAESFAELTARAVAAVNRCLAAPSPVLIVSHGAFFRALRAAMGLDRNVRTPNATPYWCSFGENGWELTGIKLRCVP